MATMLNISALAHAAGMPVDEMLKELLLKTGTDIPVQQFIARAKKWPRHSHERTADLLMAGSQFVEEISL